MMSTEIRELPRAYMPSALVYATSVTCAVLAAMAVQILLDRAGIELAGVWRDLFSRQVLQLRSAGAWWLMAGSAFIVGAVIAATLSRLALPWHGFRLLRWMLGAAMVAALAQVGHLAATASGHGGGAQAAVSLVALLAAALLALFGAYFAARR